MGAEQSSPPANAPQHWLFGKWKGVTNAVRGSAHSDAPPTIVEVDLHPGSALGTVEGTRKLYRAAPKGTVFQPAEIDQSEIQGEYDDLSQSVCLFDKRGEATRLVLDLETHALAGCVDGRAERARSGRKPYVLKPNEQSHFSGDGAPFPFSLLWRDTRGDELVDDILAKMSASRALPPPRRRSAQPRRRGATPSQPETPPEAVSTTQWQPPSIEKLGEWPAAIYKRNDLVDPRNPLIPSSQRQGFWVNLFEDGYFSSYFGKRYDELSATDLRSIYGQFLAQRPPTGSPPVAVPPLRSEYPYLAELFNGPDVGVLIGVNWWRTVSHWLSATVKRLATMPANTEAFPQLDFTDATAAAELRTLWPEERQKFTKLTAETRARIAEPVMKLKVDQLISTSKTDDDLRRLETWQDPSKEIVAYLPTETKKVLQQRIDARLHELAGQLLARNIDMIVQLASGLDGAHALFDWEKHQAKELLRYVSAEDKARARARTEERLDPLLTSLIQQDEHNLPISGKEVAAVTAENNWFRKLNEAYGFASSRRPFQDAIKRLVNRRAEDLGEAVPGIIAEINKQSSEKAVDNTRNNYLCVPGDGETTAAATITEAANARKKAIQREQMLARYSLHEREWLAPNGRIVVPSKIPEPDEEDLRIGLVRTLEMMGGERVAPFTIHWSNNPIAQRFGIYLIIDVNKVEKLACSQVSGGYRVSYRPQISCNWSEGFEKFAFSQPSLGGTMLQGLTRQLNGPQGTKEDRFELNERGWWSPTMRDNGMGGD
jgi:hypothetical protein